MEGYFCLVQLYCRQLKRNAGGKRGKIPQRKTATCSDYLMGRQNPLFLTCYGLEKIKQVRFKKKKKRVNDLSLVWDFRGVFFMAKQVKNVLTEISLVQNLVYKIYFTVLADARMQRRITTKYVFPFKKVDQSRQLV